jgi:hypothetical protein
MFAWYTVFWNIDFAPYELLIQLDICNQLDHQQPKSGFEWPVPFLMLSARDVVEGTKDLNGPSVSPQG